MLNKSCADRFISYRPTSQSNELSSIYGMKEEVESNVLCAKDRNEITPDEENRRIYTALLQNQVLGLKNRHLINKLGTETCENMEVPAYKEKFNILKFKEDKPLKQLSDFHPSPICGFAEEDVVLPCKRRRKINKVPFKVLDAPALQDDFYLNLVDWSQSNQLAVGLSNCVYLWSAANGRVAKLNDLGPRDSVTSVCWSRRGSHLSIGTNSGTVQIWDVTKSKLIRTMEGHESRVGALAWSNNILSSGSRDKSILHRDTREPEHFFSKLEHHKQEVCGLKWSFDDQYLASGGNDNKLLLWSQNGSPNPIAKFKNHNAAVKAIAWSPHQHGLLASGGGTADRCIRFWNTQTATEQDVIQTNSQVCNLIFSKNVNEFVSTHGYSENQITIWKYPSLKKVATLTGHTFRVLYLAMSPDGQTIVTGAGDETLRFWKIFPQASSGLGGSKMSSLIDVGSLDVR